MDPHGWATSSAAASASFISRARTIPTGSPFDTAFLTQVQGEEEPLTAAEADLAGLWNLEPLHPDAGWPGAVAVLRLCAMAYRYDMAILSTDGDFPHFAPHLPIRLRLPCNRTPPAKMPHCVRDKLAPPQTVVAPLVRCKA
jgi:hypothetical protein